MIYIGGIRTQVVSIDANTSEFRVGNAVVERYRPWYINKLYQLFLLEADKNDDLNTLLDKAFVMKAVAKRELSNTDESL